MSFNVDPGPALIEVTVVRLFVAEATIGVVWFTPVSVITDMPVFAVPEIPDKLTETVSAVDVALSSITLKYIAFLIPLAAIDALPSAIERDRVLKVTLSIVGGVPAVSVVTIFTNRSRSLPAGKVYDNEGAFPVDAPLATVLV